MKVILNTPNGQFPFTVRDNVTADDMPAPKNHTVRIERPCKKGIMPVEGKMKVVEGDIVTLTRIVPEYDGEARVRYEAREIRHTIHEESRVDHTRDRNRRRDR